MKKLWILLLSVFILSFAILGWVGTEIFRQAPPIPREVEEVGTDGEKLFVDKTIEYCGGRGHGDRRPSLAAILGGRHGQPIEGEQAHVQIGEIRGSRAIEDNRRIAPRSRAQRIGNQADRPVFPAIARKPHRVLPRVGIQIVA